MGGLFSERSGVVNIALEGILLTGAFASAVTTYFLGSPWLGVLAGMMAGVAIALVHAVISVTFSADQIVSGVAINLLAAGGTQFLTWIIFGSSANSPIIPGMAALSISYNGDGLLGDVVHAINTVFGHYPPLVYLALLTVIVGHVILFKTVFGLRLRSVGEHPEAAQTLGISVERIRFAGVAMSGLLAGLGGAFLALNTHQFVKNMSAGRGFIALAAMIFGKWKPFGALGACLLFGFAEAVQISLQGLGIPSQFVQMTPYVLTMVALVGVIGRAIPPRALGKPFVKGR
jgi:simple sugar transport system permease protein